MFERRMRRLAVAVVALAMMRLGNAAGVAQFTENRFDFGTVQQGAHLEHAFDVTNSGNAVLRFTQAELSMPGMQARFAPAAIAPGAKGVVTIDWVTDQVAGKVEGVARIRTSDPQQSPVAVMLSGSVTPAVAIEPIPAVFLSTFAGEPAVRVLTVRNNTDQALAVSGAESGSHTTASIRSIEAGKVFAVDVRTPAKSPGRFEESLTLNTSRGALTLPVHVWIKPELYVNPDAVDFGSITAGQAPHANESNRQSVVLRRHRGTFAIKSIASDNPDVGVTSLPSSGSSDSFTLDVRLKTIAAARNISGNIRVRTDDPAFPEIIIPVSATIVPAG
jgi:hypothetical protein